MKIAVRVDPIDRDVKVLYDEVLSPSARSKLLAEQAQVILDETDSTNRSVLGRIPLSKTFVDGIENRSLTDVRPDGVIVREYELVNDVLIFIAEELKAISPYKSGTYQRSHTLFADGVEVPVGEEIPAAAAAEYVFLSDVPYSRKIEGTAGHKPESPKAPKGVYEITASKANSRFHNVASVRFGWRSPFHPYGGAPSKHRLNKRTKHWEGGHEWETRVPAIFVVVGR